MQTSSMRLSGWAGRLDLAAGGVGAVLSVNDGDLVRPDELAAVGIEYCRVPLSDSAPPQPGDLEICISALPRALSFVVSLIDRCRGVLVRSDFP
jgi:hypothetical protein